MHRPRATLLLILACLALVAALPGCGEPDVGGSGRLEPVAGGGAGDHLILEGTPYEMGWWHGHLLKDRIRALHEEWQKQAFALDGDLMSPATKERRAAALALVEPVLQKHLPEEVRREYDGLSAGCGLPVRTLLLTEMLTDILRFTEKEPRLLTGNEARGAQDVGLEPTGAWANLLAPRWVWITRGPRNQDRGTTVLSWPGSLGCVLGARADGLVALALDEPIETGREGLAGIPFRVSLTRALARSTDPEALLAALSRTTSHRVLTVDVVKGPGFRQRVAMTGDDPVDVPPPPEGPPGPLRLNDVLCGQAALCFRAERRATAVWVSCTALTIAGLPDRRPQGEIRVP